MKLAADRLDAYLSDPVRLIEDALVLEPGRLYGQVIQPWQRQFFRAAREQALAGHAGPSAVRQLQDDVERAYELLERGLAVAIA